MSRARDQQFEQLQPLPGAVYRLARMREAPIGSIQAEGTKAVGLRRGIIQACHDAISIALRGESVSAVSGLLTFFLYFSNLPPDLQAWRFCASACRPGRSARLPGKEN